MSKEQQTTNETEQTAPALPAGDAETKPAGKTAPPAKAPKSGRIIASFALLIALSALALSAYIGWRGMAIEENQPTLQTGQEQLQVQIARQQARLTETIQSLSPLNNSVSEQQQRTDRLLNRVDSLSRQLREVAGTSREGWRLAEVEYLLRLANQRLLMTADVTGAKSLLTSADAILLELDDYSLYLVREALAEDLAVLRSVPDFDQEGLYLRLKALSTQVYDLPLLQEDIHQRTLTSKKDSTKADEPVTETPVDGWQGIALNMLQQTWDSFASLFRFTPERKQPINALLTTEEDVLIRQNLRLLLEQAKLALLAREQIVYSSSLQQARGWIQDYFSLSGEPSRAMTEEIDTLSKLNVSPILPNINRALEALKERQPEPASPPVKKTQENNDLPAPAISEGELQI